MPVATVGGVDTDEGTAVAGARVQIAAPFVHVTGDRRKTVQVDALVGGQVIRVRNLIATFIAGTSVSSVAIVQ